MHPFKAPGPDGFQGIFFKQYWHIIGDDVVRLVSAAFETGSFPPALSETLIALIPKTDCPNNFKEFRPISLCNTVYISLSQRLLSTGYGPFSPKLLALTRVASYLGEGLLTTLSSSRRLSTLCGNQRGKKGIWCSRSTLKKLMIMLAGNFFIHV
jgi:hypothetical protein